MKEDATDQTTISHHCPILAEWKLAKERAMVALDQLNKMHSVISDVGGYAKHLQKLDALDDIRDKLIDSATGRKQWDQESVHLLIKIFGATILLLVGVIFYLLTGQHLGWFNLAK